VETLTEQEGDKGGEEMGVSMVDMAFYALRRHWEAKVESGSRHSWTH